MIECQFVKRCEYEPYFTSTRQKCGRYHGSYFHDIKDFGLSFWVVGAQIEVEGLQKRLKKSTLNEVASECVEYLIQPPVRKRKTKRKPKPPYGNLSLYKAYMRKGDGNENYINVLLVIDQIKNKYFWGQGPKRYAVKKRRKIKD